MNNLISNTYINTFHLSDRKLKGNYAGGVKSKLAIMTRNKKAALYGLKIDMYEILYELM